MLRNFEKSSNRGGWSTRHIQEMNKLSKIFQPLQIVPKNAVLKGQDLNSRSQKVFSWMNPFMTPFFNLLFALSFSWWLKPGWFDQQIMEVSTFFPCCRGLLRSCRRCWTSACRRSTPRSWQCRHWLPWICGRSLAGSMTTPSRSWWFSKTGTISFNCWVR